jgi:glycosyltransferase involved in cell wall biosynthesis
MEKNKLLSIVFPVMNQEDHIERVIKAYHKEISKLGIPFELIAVVNGSTDRSYEICQKVASKLPSVSAYELKEGGFGRGILYGLRKAKGSYLCYTNCARVYPDELSLCIKYYLVNSDVIIHAVRVKRDVWIRKLSSFIYNLTCRLLTGVNSTDIKG